MLLKCSCRVPLWRTCICSLVLSLQIILFCDCPEAGARGGAESRRGRCLGLRVRSWVCLQPRVSVWPHVRTFRGNSSFFRGSYLAIARLVVGLGPKITACLWKYTMSIVHDLVTPFPRPRCLGADVSRARPPAEGGALTHGEGVC